MMLLTLFFIPSFTTGQIISQVIKDFGYYISAIKKINIYHLQNDDNKVMTFSNFYDGVLKFGMEDVVQNYMVLDNNLEGSCVMTSRDETTLKSFLESLPGYFTLCSSLLNQNSTTIFSFYHLFMVRIKKYTHKRSDGLNQKGIDTIRCFKPRWTIFLFVLRTF